jgi:acetylornithine deacetylase
MASRAHELLARLVAFNTTSDRSNLDCIDFVAGYLSSHGVGSRRVPDATGAKASLLATIGDTARPGLVLSAHTDTVPANPTEWHGSPYELQTNAGRLYGRGTADMKGFLACGLAAVPDIVEAQLPYPVHLALSYDEEVGCRGAPDLIAALCASVARPRACLVGEPTQLQPVDSHKGKVAYRCTVIGREAHSAMTHLGANAIEAAAEIVTHIKQRANYYAEHGARVEGFEPAFTTLHTGLIDGGTSLNIVPRTCSFAFEVRNVPADDAEAIAADVIQFAKREVLPGLRAKSQDCDIVWEQIAAYPALDSANNAELVRLFNHLTGSRGAGKVSYGTEAGLFAREGIPSIVCGPGSMEQAHRPDEYVEAGQIDQCDALLERLVAAL